MASFPASVAAAGFVVAPALFRKFSEPPVRETASEDSIPAPTADATTAALPAVMLIVPVLVKDLTLRDAVVSVPVLMSTPTFTVPSTKTSLVAINEVLSVRPTHFLPATSHFLIPAASTLVPSKVCVVPAPT